MSLSLSSQTLHSQLLPNNHICTVGQKTTTTKKKTKIPIYFITNYRTEIKLVTIIMNYCLLQFDALNFFLGGPSTWGSLPNLTPKFFNKIVKVASQITWKQILTTFLTLVRAREPFPPWKIKLVMACLRAILRDEFQ